MPSTRGRWRVGLLVASLALRTWVAPASASSGQEQIPIGPRPLAMGGAFAALAEGADALYWNPAGLGRLRLSTLRLTNADLYGLGIQDNALTFVAPASDRFGMGVEWYHSGFDDGTLSDTIDRLQLGAGWQIHPRVGLGAGLKWRSQEQDYLGENEGRGSGLGADLGLLLRPHRWFALGAIWRDIGGSTIQFDDGSAARPYDQFLSVGVAVNAIPHLTLTADIDRDAHAGFAWRLLDVLELRGGWTKDLDGLDGARLAAGLGVRYGAANLDYTLQDHPMLDPTHHVALSIDFTLAPKLVEIHELHVDPLFASFYKSYANEPAGELVLSSLADDPLDVTIRVEPPASMGGARELSARLLPGRVERIPLMLVLDEAVLASRDNAPIPVAVQIDYESSGRRRSERRQATPTLYAAGLLNWGDGVERAAAFITPTDPVVIAFTREVLSATDGQERGLLRNRPATYAARLFDGLAACGLRYVPDPLNPYGSARGRAFAVDSIQYPAELLMSGSGDCDDSTVLYTSMLAGVGIRTALVDVPEHILVIFDTGVPVRDVEFMGIPADRFVVREDRLWIPVETTSLGEPFFVAWEHGAELLRDYDRTQPISIVDTAAAQARFAPAFGAARVDVDARAPVADPSMVSEYFSRDLAQLDRARDAHIAAFEARQKNIATAAARNRLARMYYRLGEVQRAREELESVVEEQRDATVWNNLGVVQLGLQLQEAARSSFDRARALDPLDPGVALNRAIALHLAEEDDSARTELVAALELTGGVGPALDLLSLRSTTDPSSRGADVLAVEQLALQSIESLVRRTARTLDSSLSGSTGNISSPSADKTADGRADLSQTVSDSLRVGQALPSQSGSAAEPTFTTMLRRAQVEPRTLAELLYWKQAPNDATSREPEPIERLP